MDVCKNTACGTVQCFDDQDLNNYSIFHHDSNTGAKNGFFGCIRTKRLNNVIGNLKKKTFTSLRGKALKAFIRKSHGINYQEVFLSPILFTSMG